MADGVDGTMVILNFLKNIPTEIFENEMPEVLIHHYGLRDDSGGAGTYRGGTGIEIEFETSSPYTSITSRCMERYIFGPPGYSPVQPPVGGTYGSGVPAGIGGWARSEATCSSSWPRAAFGTQVWGNSTLSRSCGSLSRL